MIKLYQFPPALGLPNASPFCLKLETWLRMAALPYENIYTVAVNRAPKGKLPCIQDGDLRLGDSGLIINDLRSRYGDLLDGHLDNRQRALGALIERTLEEHLYWGVVYFRWIDDVGWRSTRPAFFGSLQPPLTWFVPQVARRGIRRELHGHGMGRHSEKDIAALACADLAGPNVRLRND